MPAQTDDDTIRNLVQAAEARLERAETYVEHLLEALEDLGETIPPTVEAARELTDYGGAERYEFITGDAEAPAIETVADAVRAACGTLTWCQTRIRALKPGLPFDTRR